MFGDPFADPKQALLERRGVDAIKRDQRLGVRAVRPWPAAQIQGAGGIVDRHDAAGRASRGRVAHVHPDLDRVFLLREAVAVDDRPGRLPYPP